MLTYAPDDAHVLLEGALAVVKNESGLRPLRLPAPYAKQIPSTFMRFMTQCCAGVRLRMRTEATRIAVGMTVEPFESIRVGPAFPAYVELYVDGERGAERKVGAGSVRYDRDTDVELEPSPADCSAGTPPCRERVEFDLPGGCEHEVEVVLPHTARVTIDSVETDRPLVEPHRDERPRWVHYGSSISHCMEAERPSQTWPDIAARTLGYHLTDLGFSGNAQLDPCVARAIRDTPADFVSLKLGINVVNSDSMNMRAFVAAVHGFIDTIRDGHRQIPILVVSPISSPAIEEVPGPTGLDPVAKTVASFSRERDRPDKATLHRIRAALKTIVDSRRAGDPNIDYVDGRELFSAADADLLGDGLHPTVAGYRLIGNRFVAAMAPSQRAWSGEIGYELNA